MSSTSPTALDFQAIDPKELSLGHLHHTLLGLIAPRPIAFASTIDKEGRHNLSPFSYFNVFGINPPLLIFSPATSVRNLAEKDTYINVLEVPEVVINLIDYGLVEQASLSSCAFPRGISEFEKAGLTALPSDLVGPYRVAESPASFECKVIDTIKTGDGGGAGNLIICEIVKMHIRKSLLTPDGKIDLDALKPVGRMGGNNYVAAFGAALFQVTKPNEKVAIGIDALPAQIRNSHILSGKQLSRLANVESWPATNHADLPELESYMVAELGTEYQSKGLEAETLHHLLAKLAENQEIERALNIISLYL